MKLGSTRVLGLRCFGLTTSMWGLFLYEKGVQETGEDLSSCNLSIVKFPADIVSRPQAEKIILSLS